MPPAGAARGAGRKPGNRTPGRSPGTTAAFAATGGASAGAGGASGPGGPGGDGPGGPQGPHGAGGEGGEGAEGGGGKKPKGRKSRKRHGWRRLFPTWRMTLGGLLFLIVVIVGGFAIGYATVDIPAGNAAAKQQSNVYLYADGTPLARDGETNRQNVKLSKIPKRIQHTVLAAEDRDFYSESAVDPKAMVRAAWNTLTGKGKQSGSTITQQYVKNYYLDQDQTVTRKAKEFFISIKLDRQQSKDEILEGYLNTSYFGRNAYGIQAAAQAYYGVDVDELTIPQGAYLAALLNAPSAYDVTTHPANKPRAVARWNYVMDGMVSKHWMTAADRAEAKFKDPIQQKNSSAGLSGQRGYLVEAVKDYLFDHDIVDENAFANQGYRITTTIQKPKQDAFVKAVDNKLVDQLDKKNRAADKNVRAGGVSIDPKTGHVLAMYGGIDWVQQFTNNATRTDFQVGSTFKPFVFTSAVQNASRAQSGQTITPNTVYDGTSKRPVQGPGGGGYAPENEDGRSYGQIPVSVATDKSVNSVYAQMATDVGPAKVKDTAVALGLPKNTPELNAYPSIALGTANASVLDMTQAYATLANHGKHIPYSIVAKVVNKNGENVDLPHQSTTQAVTRQAADTTTAILQSVVESGTGTAAKAAGRPAAGKTGTAEEDQAALFAGYTPDLATVVSVMGQDPKTAVHKPLYGALGQARINGGGPPAEIWAQYVGDALKGKTAQKFDLRLQKGAASKPPVSPSPPSQDQGTTGDPEGSRPPATTDGGQTGGDDGGNTAPGTDGTTTGGDTTPPGDQTGGGTADGGTSTGTDGQGGGTATSGDPAGAGGPTDGGTTDGQGGTATGGDPAGGTGTPNGGIPGTGGNLFG
ncbi:transglycosylase domain-containing protein [Streptomyces sp. NPDC049954]|uniref:transglycosylase domain-containing protein n=1 Tax=Streptomyces sp. NPDC049954 TaxID=3155779 RepID=UPI0034247C2B